MDCLEDAGMRPPPLKRIPRRVEVAVDCPAWLFCNYNIKDVLTCLHVKVTCLTPPVCPTRWWQFSATTPSCSPCQVATDGCHQSCRSEKCVT
mmetsp:Transcript_244/g.547  ORF Transcript_244/g.547 Transcript_244/m.547 type:complete len:92 (-) Transcript_244:2129-2404(-)